MSYLIAAAKQADLAAVRAASPELWRHTRRYNMPVQLALAAAHEVAAKAENPATMALISLAPCAAGSPELYRWARSMISSNADGRFDNVRMNPTHTLHAVDNLALSALALALDNHAHCVGLGGAAGQAWCGLEVVLERLSTGREVEALLMAGDQEDAENESKGLGLALLFAAHPKPCSPLGRTVRLVGIERRRSASFAAVRPHAAEGLAAFLTAIVENRSGQLAYTVPPEHGDGMERVTLFVEVL
jgi:hypothetical protein